MKPKEELTHQEIVNSMSTCLRDIMAVEISHRNMVNLLHRGRAVAALVTAYHREEIMELRRTMTQNRIGTAENAMINKLGRLSKKK